MMLLDAEAGLVGVSDLNDTTLTPLSSSSSSAFAGVDLGDLDLDCPEYSDADFAFLDAVSFWMEGVLQTVLAVFGIVGNTIASVIIARKEMRNSFNLLLVSLACFDSTYLFGAILESFR